MLPKPEVIQILSHATVFVCPSIYEPLGIVNLEAMACEAAVVATATGGIVEVVDDGETGLLVPFEPGDDGTFEPRDPAAFAPPSPSASTRSCATPRAPRRWAGPAAARAVERFAWPAIAPETAALYERLLLAPSARPERPRTPQLASVVSDVRACRRSPGTRPLPGARPRGRRAHRARRRPLRAGVPRPCRRSRRRGGAARARRRGRACDGSEATGDDGTAEAGWPFFGQYVAHDITADRSPLGPHADEPAIANFRSPRANLESLYGGGPVGTPYLYDAHDPAKLLRGGGDLPRNAEGIALIGDPRNDVHVFINQLTWPDRRAQPPRRPAARGRRRRGRVFDEARRALSGTTSG